MACVTAWCQTRIQSTGPCACVYVVYTHVACTIIAPNMGAELCGRAQLNQAVCRTPIILDRVEFANHSEVVDVYG